MRYVVDITQAQADIIGKMLATGKYQNVAQFISTAIENQIHIETCDTAYVSTRASKVIINSDSPFPDVISPNVSSIAMTKIKSQPKVVSMPKFSDLSASLWGADERQCWLWGQTNKILPVKIGLRILYTRLGTEQWIDLEEYKNDAADIAANIGTAIRKYEDKKGKLRDERISAGLPDEKEFKSKLRYKGHFLAYMRKDEKLEGAMPFLRFVNLNKDEKGRIFIGMTEPGLAFASLDNPVIDHSNFDKNFSDKEIDFYLEYIAKHIKGESEAIIWLLNKILKGINNRDSINIELSRDLGSAWKKPSSAVINTQRAGLMARMFEMGLIEKEKKGVEVTYIISMRGKKFLNKA